MIRGVVLFLLAVGLSTGAGAREWANLTPESRLGGRMVSSGYLRGKVVLLDCRDYAKASKESFAEIRSLQQTWATYKTKPFMVIGSHQGPKSQKKLAKILDRLGVTYPVYEDAAAVGVSDKSTEEKIYVFDSTGTVCLYTGDSVQQANGVLGSAIFATLQPTAAKQWKRLLDFEIEALPGQAYLRLKHLLADKESLAEVRREYPEDMKRYEEAYKKLKGDAEVKKLSKLVELARLVKDRDTASSAGKRMTKAHLEKQIKLYEPLKESENEFVSQEAKNAIADLKFAQATLSK